MPPEAGTLKCPICGLEGFASVKGVSQHMKRLHGNALTESRAPARPAGADTDWKMAECPHCGQITFAPPKAHFCGWCANALVPEEVLQEFARGLVKRGKKKAAEELRSRLQERKRFKKEHGYVLIDCRHCRTETISPPEGKFCWHCGRPLVSERKLRQRIEELIEDGHSERARELRNRVNEFVRTGAFDK